MSMKHPRYLLIVAALLLSAFQTEADTARCVHSEALIQLDVKALADVAPCDYGGFLYILGQTARAPTSYDGSLSGDGYEYYQYVRFYLRALEHGSPTDAYAFLVAAEPIISSISAHPDERLRIYQTHGIIAYWDSRDDLSDDARRVLGGALQVMLNAGFLRNADEVKCFVRSDIPTLTVQSILESRVFNTCVAGRNG